ncbi:TetR family transcriptional regulator [Parafrankia sp. EUN1f]|uniref:TetR family transcriptional regulator n=1 Tax=Parafrankia sp. EUN1f TaxID=102897 RepID=UPI0001C4466A|nr:TetR family transcriptional regulator [Parafrankia sp. EUN1f]EFC85401.1 transcriptional regulator, TetR family [Parafrankia sp. EUN1f]
MPPTSLPLSPTSVEAGARTDTAAPRAQDARLRLLLAAERLYAEQGLEAVSLRHICRAAGNGNNNAVQYHFGGEPGLLAAIVAYRVPPLDRRRAELLAAARSRGRARTAGELTVRELFDVLMRPLAEEARRPDSWYVGFLSRFSAHPPRLHPWWAGGRPAGAVGHEVSLTILGLLAKVPVSLRPLRLSHLVRLCLTALAEYGQFPAENPEHAENAEGPENPYAGTSADISYEIYVADLFDMASAALTAPASTV